MTVDEFKLLVRQGRGNAGLNLREEPDKETFRQAVIDAALTDYRYDRQCSDDQAWFICQLIHEFGNPDSLVAEIEKHRFDNFGDNYAHYVTTLAFLAKGGYVSSGAIVRDFFYRLFDELSRREAVPDDYDTKLFDFRVTITEAAKAGVITPGEVDSCITALLRKEPVFHMWDFYAEITELINYGITDFKSVMPAYNRETERIEALRKKEVNRCFEDSGTLIEYLKSGKPIDFGMKKYMKELNPPENLAVSDMAYRETDIKRKTVLYDILPAFIAPKSSMLVEEAKKYEYALNNPDSPEYLLELKILDKFGSTFSSEPYLREYAKELCKKDYPESVLIRLRAQLFEDPDLERFSSIVKSFPVTPDGDDTWHAAHFAVTNLCSAVENPPYDLLYYVYETTLCACCRFWVFRILNDKGLLTDDMRREGQYDSEANIRHECPDTVTG